MILVAIVLIAIAQATSVLLGDNKLRHLSPVSDLNVFGDSILDPLSLSFRVPLDQHLSNLERRWYVQADPNAMDDLLTLNTMFSGDSSALYGYLTRNTTLEVPGKFLDFKVELFPHEQRAISVNGELMDDMNTAQGTAYRKVETRSGVSWKPVGWARFVLHNETEGIKIQGAFEVDDQAGLGFPSTVYHLTSLANLHSGLDDEEIAGHLGKRAAAEDYVVWRDFDVRETTKGTPLSSLNDYGLNDYTFLEGMSAGHLFRRDDTNDTTSGGVNSGINLYNRVGDTSGCPRKRQVALVGLLADCNYVADFPSTSNLRQHMLDIVNRASQLYENAFNITLGLSDIIIADNNTCTDNGTDAQPWNYKCTAGSNALGDRLGRVTTWRTTRSNDSLATWSLMTKCDAGAVVGLSWLGTVCSSDSTTAAGTNVVTRTNLDHLVLAHEIGHSFGAVHDCTTDTCSSGLDKTSECCPRSKDQCVSNDGVVYVMNPASTESIGNFSLCSQGNVCGGILAKSVNTTCLQANTGGLNLYANNTCGNGIVEDGEECDCGGEQGCGENSCCDPTTCKFKQGAVCDDSNDECCSGCKYASSETMCRASTGPCDFPEYCTGNSTRCPTDKYADDGTSCQIENSNGTTGLSCMSGHCTSRDLQCKNVMKGYTTNNGSPLGSVRACSDDSSCTLSCQSSNYGSGYCFTTNSYFLDGTPCRGSGRCSNGRCIGGSSSGSFFGGDGSGGNGSFPWRWVVIAVAIFVGLLLVGFIFGIFKRSTGGRRGPVARTRNPVVPPPGQAFAGGSNMPAPGYYDQNFTPVQPNSYVYDDLQCPQPPPQAYRGHTLDPHHSHCEPFYPPPPPPPPR